MMKKAEELKENMRKTLEMSRIRASSTPQQTRASSANSATLRSRAQSLTISEAQVSESPLSNMMYASHSGAHTHR